FFKRHSFQIAIVVFLLSMVIIWMDSFRYERTFEIGFYNSMEMAFSTSEGSLRFGAVGIGKPSEGFYMDVKRGEYPDRVRGGSFGDAYCSRSSSGGLTMYSAAVPLWVFFVVGLLVNLSSGVKFYFQCRKIGAKGR
ncbi:MAG: hypothetical protein KDM63_21410, partial [Verrucomicrobiae bacterium]|nr:hypothetical protein [Verrucomicrobiae bacterium]